MPLSKNVLRSQNLSNRNRFALPVQLRCRTYLTMKSDLHIPLHRCFVEVDSEGLEGYWKLDDMSDECKDYTGHGHTAVKEGSGAIEWMTEVPCP